MVVFMSEPGVTHDGGGIGTNIDVRAPYYGRAINHGYGVYLRFAKTDGTFEFWNTSATAGANNGKGTKRFWGDVNGNTFSQLSSRAPIFYDSNDTGYYVNPASTSNLNALTVGGSAVATQSWVTSNANSSNANLLDGLNSTQFLRSDADDSFTGNLTTGTDNHITFGPNTTWGSSLRIGGNGHTATGTEMASVVTTNGNLHLDSADDGSAMYLNFYAGTGGVNFGNGANGVSANMTSSGILYANQVRATLFYDSNNTGYYVNPESTSLMYRLELNNHIDMRAQTNTWIEADVMTDAIGWNTNYGVYIGSNIGGTHYLRGNGTFTTGGSTYNLYHTGNFTPSNYLLTTGKAADSNLLDGINSTSFLRSDISDETSSGVKTWFGTALDAGSGARIQVNGFQRTGNIYLHSGGNAPDNARNSDYLSNNNGDLHWNKNSVGNGKVYTSLDFTNNSGNWNTAYTHSQAVHAPSNAEANIYSTPTELLTAIKTVDGSGSGLDADTVDGIQGASFLRSDSHDFFTGKLSVGSTSTRRAGMYGIYDANKIGHIWSMGTGFTIDDNGATFGNLYGAAYKHTNNTTGGTMGGGHQFVWTDNGDPRGSIGYNAMWHAESMKAPIFYDSNNTGYYLNPASTSNLHIFRTEALGVNTSTSSTNKNGVSLYGATSGGEPTYGMMFTGTAGSGTHGAVTSDWATYFTMNNASNRGWIFRRVGDGNSASISAAGAATFDSYVRSDKFYDTNNTNSWLDIRDTSGNYHLKAVEGGMYFDAPIYYFRDIENGVQRFTIDAGIGTATSSLRAPIFYDSDNTGYYVNPASTSNLNTLNIGNILSVNGTSTLNGNVTSNAAMTIGTTLSVGSYINVPYVNATEPIESYNPFGAYKQHDGVLTNAMAGRHNRFDVTIDGTIEPGASAKLSNQNFEEYNQNRLFGTSAGETKVFNINVQKLATGSVQSSGITYSAGFFDVCFYSSPFPASWSARVKNKDGVWTTVTSFTKIGNSKLRGIIPIGNWLTDIEFTLTARTSAPFVTGNITYGISEFELFFSRMAASQGGNLSALGGYVGGTITSDGRIQTTNDMRAPSFYDSDDTSYYLNPASGSTINGLYVAGFSEFYSNSHFEYNVNVAGTLDGYLANIDYLGLGAAPNTSGGYRLNMGGSIDMNNAAIDYASQLHFQDNVRFYDDGNDSYLNFKYGDATTGGIKFLNGGGTVKGYVYASNESFGLLDSDGSWAVRTQTGTNPLELRCDNNTEFQVYSSYTLSPGSSRAPIFYDSNDTGYYVNPAGSSNLWGLVIKSGDLRLYDNNTYSSELRFQNNTHHMGIDYQNNETLRFITRSGATTVPITFQMRAGTITAANFILSSDERKKTKIVDLSCDNIDVSWKSFEMKDNEGEYRTGVIAQELEQKHPEFVNTNDEGFKSVKYIDLLIAKIAELEARLEKLEK